LGVEQATLEDYGRTHRDERFAALAIWNTFDQLPRPRELLAAVRGLLEPGGLVALRVPHGVCFRRLVARPPLPLPPLAWNHLPAFPYLHGHGLVSLDRLLGDFGFARIGTAGDTLGAAADQSYARWARLEERAVKTAQRARFARDLGYAPWLDVLFRDAAASPS